jgi:hypothetical protein
VLEFRGRAGSSLCARLIDSDNRAGKLSGAPDSKGASSLILRAGIRFTRRHCGPTEAGSR